MLFPLPHKRNTYYGLDYKINGYPYLTADFKYTDQAGFNSVISDIKRDLDDRDCERVEFLLRGFSDKGLDADFYAEALRSLLFKLAFS